jgi:hypothetical protein
LCAVIFCLTYTVYVFFKVFQSLLLYQLNCSFEISGFDSTWHDLTCIWPELNELNHTLNYLTPWVNSWNKLKPIKHVFNYLCVRRYQNTTCFAIYSLTIIWHHCIISTHVSNQQNLKLGTFWLQLKLNNTKLILGYRRHGDKIGDMEESWFLIILISFNTNRFTMADV